MGGKAFDQTRPILKTEIEPTLKWLSEKIDIPFNYLTNHLLGSAGKAESSGDIDINMDDTIFNFSNISERLITALGAESVRVRTGNNQIFCKVPIKCDPCDNSSVQIDFMFGNLEWQEFSYWSPGPVHHSIRARSYEGSKYKGLFRTELIKAVVAFHSNWVLYENDEMIARVGPTFFHDRGIVWRYRYRPFKKNSKTERIKAFKELSESEFLKIFPSAIPASSTIISDPSVVSEMLFYNRSWRTMTASYETLDRTISRFYPRQHRATIAKIYLERLNSLKIDIPDDILNVQTSRAKQIK